MGSGPSFPVVSLPRERVILVTGANSGIGYEIAKWTAMMGATVILAARSEDRTQKAMAKMQLEFLGEKEKGTTGIYDGSNLNIQFMKLDLGSFKSVLQFCEDFKKTGLPLHVLFCNAGLGFAPFRQTEDGFEELLQVNYLGHFVIIAKLLPIMKKSGSDCRVLLTSSSVHKQCTFNLETMNYAGPPEHFAYLDYYGRSKLYQIMQTFAMARRLKGSNITINSVHPGLVDTEFFRDIQSTSKLWACTANCMSCLRLHRTTLKGATCPIDLTVNPKHAGVSGYYWSDCKITTPSSTARNEQKQEQLWNKTFTLVKQYLTDDEILGMEGE